MAAFLPQPQIPSRPLQDLLPSSPPDQTMFHLSNLPQTSASTRNLTESRAQHRVSGDYRNSGIAGFPAGDGLPVPAGPQAHLVNGGLRNRGPLGGAVFEGARSPPGTKSTSCSGKSLQSTWAEHYLSIQTLRTCRANSSDRASVKQAKHVPFLIRQTSPPSTRRASIFLRYAQCCPGRGPM